MQMITFELFQNLLRQGLAIRGHEEVEGNLIQLLLLRSKHISGLKQYISDKHYLSGDIMIEIIALMSNAVLWQLLSDIREACTFSLKVDEATDTS